MSELLRPWKLTTLALGIATLVAGRFIVEAPDWDIGVSLVMAGVAYVTAAWAMRVFLERRWRLWPLALLATWFGVDGCYWIYWNTVNPSALIMREANAPASLSLYLACGILWLPRSSLSSLVQQLRAAMDISLKDRTRPSTPGATAGGVPRPVRPPNEGRK
jgi:hypothetical protein